MNLITIKSYSTQGAAVSDQSYLEASGITTFLQNAAITGLVGPQHGGIKLQVAKEDAEKARELLKKTKRDPEE